MNRPYLNTVISILLFAICATSWADLTAKVDRTTLYTDETLQFVMRYNGQAITSEPDFSPLKKDFDILSNNRQQQYSWVNGKAQSYTDWNMVLMPKRTGVILIPSISFKKDVSNALEITVRTANKITAGAGKQPVYTETLIDKAAVYIQEQIILTQRLYTSVQLQDLTLSELDVPDAIVQRIGETQFQKVINGRNYLIIEVTYALFPQINGKLDIPALRFGAFENNVSRQFGAFSSRGKQLFRNTQAKTIDVMAKPAHIPIDQWMPSSKVELKEQWSSDFDSLTVGEPITRSIQITAQGLTGAQIQPLTIADNGNYKAYPDQPKIEEQATATGIVGVRTETVAIVPNEAGELILPAIEVHWWGTKNQRMQTTSLAAKTLQVNPAAANSPSPQLSGQSQSQPLALTPLILNTEKAEPSSLIKWSLAFNALLLAALVALFVTQKARPKSAAKDSTPTNSAHLNLKQKLKAIETQARQNNLLGMRDGILDWGKTMFPDSPPATLKHLAELLGDDQLNKEFDDLDRQLYRADSSASTLDTKTLIKQLKTLSATGGSVSQKSPKGQPLKSLYPEGK